MAGGGGRKPQAVPPAHGQVAGEFKYEHSDVGHGYLLISARNGSLHVDYRPVPGPAAQNQDKVDNCLGLADRGAKYMPKKQHSHANRQLHNVPLNRLNVCPRISTVGW